MPMKKNKNYKSKRLDSKSAHKTKTARKRFFDTLIVSISN